MKLDLSLKRKDHLGENATFVSASHFDNATLFRKLKTTSCDGIIGGVQIIFDVWDEDGDDWWQKEDLEAFARATKSFGIEEGLAQDQYEDLIAQMGGDVDEGIDSETLAL